MRKVQAMNKIVEIVLRYSQELGWRGMIVVNDNERWKTGGHYARAKDALERCLDRLPLIEAEIGGE